MLYLNWTLHISFDQSGFTAILVVDQEKRSSLLMVELVSIIIKPSFGDQKQGFEDKRTIHRLELTRPWSYVLCKKKKQKKTVKRIVAAILVQVPGSIYIFAVNDVIWLQCFVFFFSIWLICIIIVFKLFSDISGAGASRGERCPHFIW